MKAISHVQPDVTPVNVYGFEDIQPWLDHFGARDGAHLSQLLGLDAFPDAPPVYRGPLIPPGRDIWGASYSWTGARGAGYSAERVDTRWQDRRPSARSNSMRGRRLRISTTPLWRPS